MISELGVCGCCQPQCDREFTFIHSFSGTRGLLSDEIYDLVNHCNTHYLQVDIVCTITSGVHIMSGLITYTWNRWTNNLTITNGPVSGSVPGVTSGSFYSYFQIYDWFVEMAMSDTFLGIDMRTHGTNTGYTYTWSDGSRDFSEEIIVSHPYTVSQWVADFDAIYNAYTWTDLKEILARVSPNDEAITFYYDSSGVIQAIGDAIQCSKCAVYAGGVMTIVDTRPTEYPPHIIDYIGIRGLHYICTGSQHCKRTNMQPNCGDAYPSTTCETIAAPLDNEVHIDCNTVTGRAWVTWEDNCTCP